MATITGSSAQKSARTKTENKAATEQRLTENVMRFSLVMSFADNLLDRNILSLGEYAAFSVETAQVCGLKYTLNPCAPTR